MWPFKSKQAKYYPPIEIKVLKEISLTFYNNNAMPHRLTFTGPKLSIIFCDKELVVKSISPEGDSMTRHTFKLADIAILTQQFEIKVLTNKPWEIK